MAGRTIDAGLRLLDRQLVDKDGRLAGKVDDLEFTTADGDGAPPYLTAILAGPGALAGRLGGRVGGWLAGLSERLRGSDRDRPASIWFGAVKEIGSAVELSVARQEVETNVVESWVREHVIGKLPGADHAAE
ncbi:MAG TPA: hypothetical protein VEP73_10780 [Actinomycetota bacterium]|nr:hypothetical protein [Actinomycetota bacterium]